MDQLEQIQLDIQFLHHSIFPKNISPDEIVDEKDKLSYSEWKMLKIDQTAFRDG